MPRYAIDLSPVQAQFNDGDPMINGLGNAMAEILRGRREGAQLAVQRQQRQFSNDLEMRRYLGEQQARSDSLGEERRYHDAETQNRAKQLEAEKAKLDMEQSLHVGELDRQTQADAQRAKYEDATLDESKRHHGALETTAQTRAAAAASARGGVGRRTTAFDPYTSERRFNPETMQYETTHRLKTGDELKAEEALIRQEHEMEGGGSSDAGGGPLDFISNLLGGVIGHGGASAAPADAGGVVAERQARNAEVRQQQVSLGLASGPGGAAPARPAVGAAPGAHQVTVDPEAINAQRTPEERHSHFVQEMGARGMPLPEDDGLIADMVSDDPATVEQALKTAYRGQPLAFAHAVDVLSSLHGPARQVEEVDETGGMPDELGAHDVSGDHSVR